MALQDDVTRLVAIMVRQHQGGQAQQLRYAAFGFQGDQDSLGQVAKACGTTRDVVVGWENGTIRPTTQQGLAWLTFLYDAQPSPFATPPASDQGRD